MLRALLGQLELRNRLVVVFVLVVHHTQLITQAQVIRVGLHAAREVVEAELLLLLLQRKGLILLALRLERINLRLVGTDLRVGPVAIQLRIGRVDLARTIKDLQGLVEALVLQEDTRECAVVVNVLGLAGNLFTRFGNRSLGIITRDHRLGVAVELRGQLLVANQGLEAAALTGIRLPATGGHRILGHRILQELLDIEVGRIRLRDALEAIPRPVVDAALHIGLAHPQHQIHIIRAGGRQRLHRRKQRLRVIRPLRHVKVKLIELGGDRVDVHQLLGHHHRLLKLVLLDQAIDLAHLHLRAQLGHLQPQPALLLALEEANTHLMELPPRILIMRGQRQRLLTQRQRNIQTTALGRLRRLIQELLRLNLPLQLRHTLCHNWAPLS